MKNKLDILSEEFVLFKMMQFPNNITKNERLLDVIGYLLDYESVIAGIISNIIDGYELSSGERKILNVDHDLDAKIQCLLKDNTIDGEEVNIVYRYKKAIDNLIELGKEV